MNYSNLYFEAIEAVRRGVMSIVFVPNGMEHDFKCAVRAMHTRDVKMIGIDFTNGLTEFQVLYR